MQRVQVANLVLSVLAIVGVVVLFATRSSCPCKKPPAGAQKPPAGAQMPPAGGKMPPSAQRRPAAPSTEDKIRLMERATGTRRSMIIAGMRGGADNLPKDLRL